MLIVHSTKAMNVMGTRRTFFFVQLCGAGLQRDSIFVALFFWSEM